MQHAFRHYAYTNITQIPSYVFTYIYNQSKFLRIAKGYTVNSRIQAHIDNKHAHITMYNKHILHYWIVPYYYTYSQNIIYR